MTTVRHLVIDIYMSYLACNETKEMHTRGYVQYAFNENVLRRGYGSAMERPAATNQ